VVLKLVQARGHTILETSDRPFINLIGGAPDDDKRVLSVSTRAAHCLMCHTIISSSGGSRVFQECASIGLLFHTPSMAVLAVIKVIVAFISHI